MTGAGYSGTPLPKKLGIRPGARVALVDPPPGAERLLEPWPDGAELVDADAAELDVLVFFVAERAELAARFGALVQGLVPAGSLWIAWPKRSSGVVTDLTENVLRDVILPSGLVDTKVCAIDGTWAGLRFVRRLATRGGGAKKGMDTVHRMS
jgi:hypothetical protein